MTGVDRTLQGSYGPAHLSLDTKGRIAVNPKLKSALESKNSANWRGFQTLIPFGDITRTAVVGAFFCFVFLFFS